MESYIELPTDVLHQVFDLLPSSHLAAVSEVRIRVPPPTFRFCLPVA